MRRDRSLVFCVMARRTLSYQVGTRVVGKICTVLEKQVRALRHVGFCRGWIRLTVATASGSRMASVADARFLGIVFSSVLPTGFFTGGIRLDVLTRNVLDQNIVHQGSSLQCNGVAQQRV